MQHKVLMYMAQKWKPVGPIVKKKTTILIESIGSIKWILKDMGSFISILDLVKT